MNRFKLVSKALAVVAAKVLLVGFVVWEGCSTSQVTTAYKSETAIDAAVSNAWILWNSYLVNSKINGTPIDAAIQAKVSAAFNKVRAAELVAIDATAVASGTTNGVSSASLLSSVTPALTDLENLLATFKIKL